MPRRRSIHSFGRSEKREWSWRSTRNIVAVGGGLETALEGGAQDLINLAAHQRKFKIARMEAEADEIGLAQPAIEIFVPNPGGKAPPAGPRAVTKRPRRFYLVEARQKRNDFANARG